MIKSKYKIALILALFFGFQACTKDFLELDPKNGQAEANFYQTENDALLAVTAVYDAYSVQNWQFVPTMSDIFSDDAFKGGSNAQDMQQWYHLEKGTMTAENGSASDLWNRCYSGIYRANLYLQKEADIQWETDGLQDRLKAEAKFLRAYFYWDLVRHYGWVPIITEVYPDIESYRNVDQNSPDEVFTQIASDLLSAIANLPETVPASEAGRVTKYAAQALLARIYLFHEGFAKPVLGTGNWTDGSTVIDKTYAQGAVEEIIGDQQYILLDNYEDVFAWDNENNAEILLSMQYSEKANSGDWGGWNINGNFSVVWIGPRDPVGDPIYAVAGWSFSTLSWSLYNEYESGDPRRDVTFYNAEESLDSYTRAYQNTGYFNKKYIARQDFPFEGGDPAHNWRKNYIDIRYADVLLMAAELFLYDDLGKAQGYYEQVRNRAFGDSHTAPTLTSDEAGLDLIYKERRVELGGEGQRKWDLLRRSLTFAQQKIEESFDVPDGIPNPEDFQGFGLNPDTYGMFPIPAAEIRNTNDGVLQQQIPAYQ